MPFVLLIALLAGRADQPIRTSVCAVIANPRAYDRKVVTVRADVLTDWHHGSILVDPSCKGGFNYWDDAAPRHEARALDHAIGTLLDGGGDRTASATFTGRVTWHPRKRSFFQSPFELRLTRIENVTERLKERR